MKKAIVTLKSSGFYSQSRVVRTESLPRETHDDYEARTWRDRCHVDEEGYIFIPVTQIVNCIKNAAKYMSIQIPGQGKATYTKNFAAGIMAFDDIHTGMKKDEVEGEWLHVPSDGRAGGSKRVFKCFPRLTSWEGSVEIIILDDIITEDVFLRVVNVAGSLVGIGRYRPQNRGNYGRFTVEGCEWIENVEAV